MKLQASKLAAGADGTPHRKGRACIRKSTGVLRTPHSRKKRLCMRPRINISLFLRFRPSSNSARKARYA